MPAIQLSEIRGGQQRRKGGRFQVVTETCRRDSRSVSSKPKNGRRTQERGKCHEIRM
jgi:hypothetical protein